MTADVLVHANTGEDVGLGHLVRCLTLTREFMSRGIETEIQLKDDNKGVEFAADEGAKPVISESETLLRDLISSSADIVVIDSYEFTTEDFEELAEEKTLVVVDELGDRRIPADLVVNNNIYADEIDYPAADSVLRGPKYCMLREPFRDLGEPQHTQLLESILVTIGGANLSDAFVEILNVTAAVAEDATVNAVVGPYFEPPEDASDEIIFYREPPNIHELMWEADLAVSGGGQTLYELAACATPTVALTLGADQVCNICEFKRLGFCRSVGSPSESGFTDRLSEHLTTLRRDPEARRRMGRVGMSLVDGNGVFRVADSIEKLV